MGNREQIAEAIFNVRDDEFDLDEWDDLDSTEKERYLCDADAVLASPAIAKLKADTLREAADDLHARANGPALIRAVDRWGGYYGGVWTAMQNEESALRLRADAIERLSDDRE